MKIFKKIIAVAVAVVASASLGGCAVKVKDEEDMYAEIPPIESGEIPEELDPSTPEITEENPHIEEPEPEVEPEPQTPTVTVPPKAKTVSYIFVNTDSVNLRSGPGTGYSVRGTAQKSTLYADNGASDGWVKTGYKDGNAYLSAKYCSFVELNKSDDERVEAVIAEGTKYLGTVYVYGATRLHDGKGNMNKGFTTKEFDCSSLMQYIFYKGSGKLLNVTTRTQISQGKTVKRADLKRGDLMFFTNASRKNNTGIERVGHVALYLGDNWILHTASDYAKIEQISQLRWSYFIQGQRIF